MYTASRRCLVARPAPWVATVMQAGQYRDALLAQQFEMQGIRKSSQQDPAEATPCGRKGLWVARQLFFGRCEHTQKIATQAVGFLFVPVKGFGNFGLRRRFKNDLPGHRRTPSDCAIWARLLPCPGWASRQAARRSSSSKTSGLVSILVSAANSSHRSSTN